jgi:hypothetical protein
MGRARALIVFPKNNPAFQTGFLRYGNNKPARLKIHNAHCRCARTRHEESASEGPHPRVKWVTSVGLEHLGSERLASSPPEVPPVNASRPTLNDALGNFMADGKNPADQIFTFLWGHYLPFPDGFACNPPGVFTPAGPPILHLCPPRTQ